MKLKAALFGAGAMGQNHARVISQSHHSELTYVIDTDQSVGKEVAMKYQSAWLPELQSFKGIDYAVIATPTELHFDIAMYALNSGVPLIIEKPISNSYEQTIVLLELARNLGIPLVCGFVERYNPAILTLKQILGEPLTIHSIRHSPMTPRIKTSVASDLLVHDLDLAIDLFGQKPIDFSKRTLSSLEKSEKTDDSIDVILSFSRNRYANISASRLSHKKIRSMNIIEAERLIEVDLLRRDLTIYRHIDEGSSKDGVGYKQQTIIEIPTLVTSEEPLAAQLKNFIEILKSDIGLRIDQEIQSIAISHELLGGIEK
jgi:predicted dehydrogenase